MGKFGGLINGLVALLLLFSIIFTLFLDIDINYNIMMGDFIQKMYFPFFSHKNKKFSYMD